MSKNIINRLNVIKNLCALEEDDSITQHIEKLAVYNDNEAICYIIKLLTNKDYIKAINKIDEYLKNTSALVIYKDSIEGAKKLRLEYLKQKNDELSIEITQLENMINTYNRKYQTIVRPNYIEFNYLYNELNNLKTKLANKKFVTKKKAKGSYTDNIDLKPIEPIQEFSDAKLKQMYRQVSKIIHPDCSNDSLKEISTELMAQVNKAYKQKNILFITDVLKMLQSNSYSSLELLDDGLLFYINLYENKIMLSNLKIDNLKKDAGYINSITYDDIDTYLYNLSNLYKEHINMLKVEQDKLNKELNV